MENKSLPARIYDWLQRAISIWQSEGIINADQAQQLQARYVRSGQDVWLVWVLGLLAALFIGGGVILLLAYNWHELAHLTRVAIALLPLLVAQAASLWLMKRHRMTHLLGEIIALLLGAILGAALALVSQTYHLYGELWQFFTLWLVMLLPSALILRVQALFIAAMSLAIATLVVAPSVYSDGIRLLPSLVWWVVGVSIALGGLFSVYQRLFLCRWAVLLAVLAYVGIYTVAQGIWQYFWLPFSVLYAIGLLLRENGWRNAPRWLGAAGLYALLLLFAVSPNEVVKLAKIEPLILLVTEIIVVGLGIQVWRTIPERAQQTYRLCLLAAPLYMANIGSTDSTTVFVVAQLGLLGTGLLLVAGGLAQVRLLVANAGLLLLLTQLLMLFFDSDWSLLGRGIGFIACGVLLLGVNVFLLKRRVQRQIVTEPHFPVLPVRHLVNGRWSNWVFGVLCVAQVAYIANTVVQAEWTLSDGAVYRFQTQPVDPYDPFRGRYVNLNFALEDMHFPFSGRTCAEWRLLPAVYAVLAHGADGVAKVIDLSAELPPDRDAIRIERPRCDAVGIKIRLPFHRFYANELLAPQLEQQARSHASDSYLVVRVRGRYAVPESLQIGAKRANTAP